MKTRTKQQQQKTKEDGIRLRPDSPRHTRVGRGVPGLEICCCDAGATEMKRLVGKCSYRLRTQDDTRSVVRVRNLSVLPREADSHASSSLSAQDR